MDWSNDGEAVTINLTVQMDYCVLQY
jgi:hypothetical protein